MILTGRNRKNAKSRAAILMGSRAYCIGICPVLEWPAVRDLIVRQGPTHDDKQLVLRGCGSAAIRPRLSAGLKSLAANGKLKAVDLVRKNGAQSWCRAETIKGLFDEKVRNQPAVPPMPAAHVPPPATSSEAPQPVDFWLPAAPITSPGSSKAPLPPSFRRRPVSARIRWLGPGAGLKLVMIGGVIGLCMLSFVAGIVFQAVRSPMVVPDLKAMVRVPAVPNLGEAMLRRGTYVTTTKVLLLQFEVADIAANGSLLTGLLSQKQDPYSSGSTSWFQTQRARRGYTT